MELTRPSVVGTNGPLLRKFLMRRAGGFTRMLMRANYRSL
jgi:hypothetical protein